MIIIETKKQLQRLCKLDRINPCKRIQLVAKYGSNEFYKKNISNQFIDLVFMIAVIVISPILIIYQFFLLLKSFGYWTLIYTKKNLSDDELITDAKFKYKK